MFVKRSFRLLFLVPTVVVLTPGPLKLSAQSATAAPTEGWHFANPPFTPEALLAHGTTLWAAGSAESIAVSTDLGQHWHLKHRDPGGQVLLTLNFPDNLDSHFGYAAGTRGTILITEDGGETWTPNIWAPTSISPTNLPPEAILQAAFGDRQHGIIRTPSALLATTNAGLTWRTIVPISDPGWKDKFPVTVGLAALDKDHLAVRVSAGPSRDGEYLWTSDGGSNWYTTYVGNSEIDSLFTLNGMYWSVGHSVLERPPTRRDKFGAGESAPMTFHSQNGALWETNPLNWEVCHWHDCSACSPQGCFAGKSSFLRFHQTTRADPSQADLPKDWLAHFPAHQTLSSQWAQVDNTLCLLTHAQIECTTLQPVTDLDTPEFEMPGEQATFEDSSIAAIGKIPIAQPQCIRCQLDPVYLSHAVPSGPIDLKLSFTIEPDGTVTALEIGNNFPEDLRAKIQTQAGHWLFEPTFKDNAPISVPLTVSRPVILLNPTQLQSPSTRAP